MRHLFTLILFFIYINSFGQEFSTIKSRIDLLETNINFKLDSTGLSKLPLPIYNCAINNSENNWHIQDLNNGGLKDLIYSGTCQPYHQTAIFLNSKRGFKLVHDFPGKLISITDSPSIVKINILKSSCCCDYYSNLIEVSINNKSEIQKNTISFHFETKIETSNKLISKTLSGILRSSPKIEDSIKKDPCTDEKIIGNQFETIEKKSVIVLNEEKDWLLVLIKQSDTYSILGWVKKKS